MTKSGKQYVSYEVKQIHCCRLGFQLFKSNTTKVKKKMWYGTLTKKGGGAYLRRKTIRIDPDFFC